MYVLRWGRARQACLPVTFSMYSSNGMYLGDGPYLFASGLLSSTQKMKMQMFTMNETTPVTMTIGLRSVDMA